MTDPAFYVTMATAGLAGLAMLTVAGLNGWRGWLQLKSQELTRTDGLGRGDELSRSPAPSASTRIEIADLKERIRKLEAIAAGVDL